MRFPPLSRCIHIALLFICHFFLGTIVAAWGSYQYEQSRWLASLSHEQGRQLLGMRETLLAAQAPTRRTPDALRRDLSRLETLRRRAPQEALPLLDLRIASSRALLASLYRDANDPAAAAAQSEAARTLLRELGWRDISDATLSDLAERRLQRRERDVR